MVSHNDAMTILVLSFVYVHSYCKLVQIVMLCESQLWRKKNVYNKGQWLIAQVHWGKQVHLVQRSDMYMPTTQRAELLMLVAQRETGAQPR